MNLVDRGLYEGYIEIAVFRGWSVPPPHLPFVIGRHVHRAVPQAQLPPPETSGVDYLGLVQAAHEEEAGTGQKIDFTQLGMFPAGEELA